MSKKFGLILPRASIFEEDSDSDSAVQKPTGLKRPLKKQEKLTQHKAVAEDPTVYQYDEIYDEMDEKRKKSKLMRKDINRAPKYISKLLAAADRRKKENERRIERQVQKEREAEGDEFRDKEAFVTSAYKKKLEEMKELEEQEKRENYLESIGDVTKQVNLDGFYRHLYDQKVNYEEDDVVVKTEKAEEINDEDSATTTTKKRKYRRRDNSNAKSEDEEDVEDVKKEHLPSNLDADSDFSIDSSDSETEAVTQPKNDNIPTVNNDANIKEENTTGADVKDENPEPVITPVEAPPKPKLDIWKKRTVGAVFDAALERYFQRKASREL